MTVYDLLRSGTAIPAMPLALDAQRRLDERRQRGLIRYYVAAGAGGLAVGVHTTQFEIRNPPFNLLRPVLELAAEELSRADAARSEPLIRVAGVCGTTQQALAEATQARELGYHAGLLNLSALRGEPVERLIEHCRAVAGEIPLFGFHLQPAVGGLELPYAFWRRFAEIDRVVAIKIAAFDRYQTLEVIRAVTESGRDDIALYTGNDDNIVLDLLTPYRFRVGSSMVERRIVGGLLGHWAVCTHSAVQLFRRCRESVRAGGPIPVDLLTTAVEVTDCNAAVFDAANDFRGCVPGIHEVLRREGLLAGIWCLEDTLGLSPGQGTEIDRVCAAYSRFSDQAFIASHLSEWLSG